MLRMGLQDWVFEKVASLISTRFGNFRQKLLGMSPKQVRESPTMIGETKGSGTTAATTKKRAWWNRPDRHISYWKASSSALVRRGARCWKNTGLIRQWETRRPVSALSSFGL